jgi:hypothetical protein
VVQKNQPGPVAKPAAIPTSTVIAESEPKKTRGRPKKISQESPKEVIPKVEAQPVASNTKPVERDGRWYVGDKEFETELAAKTAIKISRL